MKRSTAGGEALLESLYRLLLAVYPAKFRREYGREMLLVFRSCYRCERARGGRAGVARLWLRTLIDLISTAPQEHAQNFAERSDKMKRLRMVALAALAYAVVFLVLAPGLSRRTGEIPYAFGALLDALMFTGVVFNFIVLVLVVPHWARPVRAVYVAGVVTLILVAAMLIALPSALPAEHRPNGVVLIAQALAFAFWSSAHWIWARRKEMISPAV